MIELEAEQFVNVLPLYRAAGTSFPLILAVIQGRQRGRIFADKQTNPNSALVITRFGFMYLFGSESNDSFNADVMNLLATNEEFIPSYLLWYSPSLYWQKKLDFFVPEQIKRRERIHFEFRKDLADYIGNSPDCPAGFELRSLDASLIHKTAKFGIDIDSRFWTSSADLLKDGLGICMIKNDDIICLCYSACVVDGLAEVDIITQLDYRGQGWATLTAKQFISECLRKKIDPSWDCFVSNHASVRLAERLGFVKINSYPFYSFHVPLNRS